MPTAAYYRSLMDNPAIPDKPKRIVQMSLPKNWKYLSPTQRSAWHKLRNVMGDEKASALAEMGQMQPEAVAQSIYGFEPPGSVMKRERGLEDIKGGYDIEQERMSQLGQDTRLGAGHRQQIDRSIGDKLMADQIKQEEVGRAQALHTKDPSLAQIGELRWDQTSESTLEKPTWPGGDYVETLRRPGPSGTMVPYKHNITTPQVPPTQQQSPTSPESVNNFSEDLGSMEHMDLGSYNTDPKTYRDEIIKIAQGRGVGIPQDALDALVDTSKEDPMGTLVPGTNMRMWDTVPRWFDQKWVWAGVKLSNEGYRWLRGRIDDERKLREFQTIATTSQSQATPAIPSGVPTPPSAQAMPGGLPPVNRIGPWTPEEDEAVRGAVQAGSPGSAYKWWGEELERRRGRSRIGSPPGMFP